MSCTLCCSARCKLNRANSALFHTVLIGTTSVNNVVRSVLVETLDSVCKHRMHNMDKRRRCSFVCSE